jgi:hypothetical protein
MARVMLAFVLVVAGFPVIILLSGAHDAWLGALRVASVTAISVLGPGVPGFIYFRCRGWWRPWQFVAGGVLGGLLSAFVFLDTGAANFGFLVTLFAGAGALHALLFWFVAVWRNPGLTLPRQFCLPDGVVYKVARGALRGIAPPRE